ncbi:MAG TPA: hypothetical protein VFV41_16880 [Streptosporangiaceae bacterium]|nr:hypothetical protein [Streptosporangiaceae bacterium]
MSKLIGILELPIPAGLDERYGLADRIPAAERPVSPARTFWDYAAAGPYLPIRAAASGPGPGAGDHKDVVFLSPHKFPAARRPPAS